MSPPRSATCAPAGKTCTPGPHHPSRATTGAPTALAASSRIVAWSPGHARSDRRVGGAHVREVVRGAALFEMRVPCTPEAELGAVEVGHPRVASRLHTDGPLLRALGARSRRARARRATLASSGASATRPAARRDLDERESRRDGERGLRHAAGRALVDGDLQRALPVAPERLLGAVFALVERGARALELRPSTSPMTSGGMSPIISSFALR